MSKLVYSSNLDLETYPMPRQLKKVMDMAHECMKHVKSAHYTQCVRLYKKDYDELDAFVRKATNNRFDLSNMRFHNARVIRV